jgi:predicted DNA-binding ribbon-helix-helix protein
MKSTVLKRSIVIDRRKTSISIEDVFWTSIKDIARARSVTLSELIASIDQARGAGTNLSSAIRVFILDHYRRRLEELGGGKSEQAHPGQPQARR